MASRLPTPDFLKGIAIITMVQVHVMEQFARPEIFAGPAGKVSLFLGGPFAAPVFMAVMGYFAGRHGGMRTLKRGISLILLGLLLNIGLNFNLLLHIFNGKSDADPLRYIFGADILPLAGLSLIIIGLLETLFRKRAVPALILAFSVAILTPYIPVFPEQFKYLEAFIAGNALWSYFPLFPWMAYPLLGYGWKKMATEMPSLHTGIISHLRWIMVIAFAVIMALAVPAVRIITDLPAYYHHGIFLFGWIVCFLAAWTYFARFLVNIAADSQIVKYINWLGMNVTIVYIIQWLIIGNLAYYFGGSQFLIQLILWFVAIMAAVSILSYFYLKMRSQLLHKNHLDT